MMFTYKQCLERCGSDYQIKLAIEKGELFFIEKGIYSDVSDVSTLEILTIKYPKAILTMDTAFYYHGLTDVIPDQYWIATNKYSRKLRDKRIQQMFVHPDILDVGVTTMKKKKMEFKIYDKERMLIELLRYKNKLPYDYYKEILGKYRDIIHSLDIERIQEYASTFPKSKMIMEALDLEVF